MNIWIKAIDDSIKCAQELLQYEARVKEVAAKPYRIRVQLILVTSDFRSGV
jgi:hypothetical protein